MKLDATLTDKAILTEIGARITRRRLDFQLTQADLAEQAGISKRTLERVEAGLTAQMTTMVRIFRVLELLPALDLVIPEIGPRPLEVVKNKGKIRQRVSQRGQKSDEPWSWDDEG